MINDEFLVRVAKLINGEDASMPSYNVFSSTVITPDGTRSSVVGELDRSSFSVSRNNKEVVFSCVRSGTTASSGGDYINSLFMTDGVSGTVVLSEATVPSLLHDSSFDFEVDWSMRVDRL